MGGKASFLSTGGGGGLEGGVSWTKSQRSTERKSMLLEPYWGIVSPCGKKRALAEWPSSDLIINLPFPNFLDPPHMQPKWLKAPRGSYRWLEIWLRLCVSANPHASSPIQIGKFSTWSQDWTGKEFQEVVWVASIQHRSNIEPWPILSLI